jgi:hypothetical protein
MGNLSSKIKIHTEFLSKFSTVGLTEHYPIRKHIIPGNKCSDYRNNICIPREVKDIDAIYVVLTFGLPLIQSEFKIENALRKFQLLHGGQPINTVFFQNDDTIKKASWLSDNKVAILVPMNVARFDTFRFLNKEIRLEFDQTDYYNIVETSFLFKFIL